MLLDDPSPLVRRALAEVFASAQKGAARRRACARHRSARCRGADAGAFAAADRRRSGRPGRHRRTPDAQAAIAGRAPLPRLACRRDRRSRRGAKPASRCWKIPAPTSRSFSLDRMVERFGHLAPIRENLLARDDLPMATRQALLSKLSQTLAGFVAARQWLGPEHAEYAAREACEKATVALAADTPYEEVGALMQHLRQSGQLTAGMILRALLSGNVVLFEEALAELSGMPIDRVTGYIHDKNISGFRALYRKAGLPDVAYPAFREAIAAMRDGHSGRRAGRGGAAQARAWSSACWTPARHERGDDSTASLLALLRRFAVEAAREEARMFCDDLVADAAHRLPPTQQFRLIAQLASGLANFARISAYSGTSDGPVICSSTSGRSRFSWTGIRR